MGGNKVAFAAIGFACVAAAGAGSYFALRQNAASTSAPVAATAPVTTTAATDSGAVNTPAKAVQETEAIVAPPAKTEKAAAKKAPQPTKTAPVAPSSPSPSATANAPKPSATPVPAPAPLPQIPAPDPIAQAARTDTVERVTQDAPAPPPPPQHTFDELVVSADSVIGLQSDTTVDSEHARVEDRVEGRVTRDVKVGDRVAIPAGSRAIGYVTQVERGGKFKEQAKLAIRFQTVVLADGTRLPINTAAVEREGDSKGNSSAAKVGGAAVAGTILGAILGGGKGAAVGGLAGAGAGAAATEAGSRSVATLRAGEPVTIRLLSPVTVTTESK